MLEGHSLVAPLIIAGLPEEIEVLGVRWRRKIEFHLTAISAETLERAGAGRPDLWQLVTRVASGRDLGPIAVREEIRRVSGHPDRPELRTLVVMADAPGLTSLQEELSQALGAELAPTPAHVTLYSSDPARGIGIDDHEQLARRAPRLSAEDEAEVRQAMSFTAVFPDDDGIPFARDGDDRVLLGGTDPVFTARVIAALAYAAHVHRDQLRKGGSVPYLAHLIGVASIVADDGGEETEVIAALLHDAAEDHGGEARLRDIERRFGPRVVSIVRGLSDSLTPEHVGKDPWRPRKERYLEHLRSDCDAATLRVSNADKLHNARAILRDLRQDGAQVWERFEAPAAEQVWYYSELAAIFSQRRAESPLAGELADTVALLREAASGTSASPGLPRG